ncbi:unnamed protein product [Caenorhabditis brenneri]
MLNLRFLFLLYIFFHKIASYTEYELIAQGYNCDPNCWFRENEVTSETISKWPVNCTEVCGTLYFTKNSDIPVFELQDYFENLKVLKGRLDFSNTAYASIEFLSSLQQVHCDVLDLFYIEKNRNLEELNFGNLTNITCVFNANNNSRLDTTQFCEKYKDMFLMHFSNNLVNCNNSGCIAGDFYWDTLYQLEGCTHIFDRLWFSVNNYADEYLAYLHSVRKISGSLQAFMSDLRNFSFLENLETIKSNEVLNYDINIQQCQNFSRFGISSLKTLSTSRKNFIMNIEQVHEDFCFTTDEMLFFLKSNVMFRRCDAKYCADKTICTFDRMSNLKENCTEIVGDVIIGANEEIYKDKLKNLKNVYGTLSIQGTSFTDLSFLGSLEYVAKLANDSVIPLRIVSNKNLQDVSLPSLKRAFSKTIYQVSFEDNGDKILNSTACLDFMDGLFDTNVVFDGSVCEVIDRVEGEKKGTTRKMVWWSFLIIVLRFWL